MRLCVVRVLFSSVAVAVLLPLAAASARGITDQQLSGGVSDGGGCVVRENGQYIPIELANIDGSLVIDEGLAGIKYIPSELSFIAGVSYFKKEQFPPYRKAVELLRQRNQRQNTVIGRYWLEALEGIEFLYSPFETNADKFAENLFCPQDHLKEETAIKLAMYYSVPGHLNMGFVNISLPVFNEMSFAHQVAMFLHDSSRELKAMYGEAISDHTIYELVRTILLRDRQLENLDQVVLRNGQSASTLSQITNRPDIDQQVAAWCKKHKKNLDLSSLNVCVQENISLNELSSEEMGIEFNRMQAYVSRIREDLLDQLYEPLSRPKEEEIRKKLRHCHNALLEITPMIIATSLWNISVLDSSPQVSRLTSSFENMTQNLDHYLQSYDGNTGQMQIMLMPFLRSIEEGEHAEYKFILAKMCREVRNSMLDSGVLLAPDQEVPRCPSYSQSSEEMPGDSK